MKKVLITGAAGAIGTVLRSGLSGYDLTLVDLNEIDHPGYRWLDVASDYGGLKEAFRGQDAVVHLARDPADDPTTPEFTGRATLGNVSMTINVYNAVVETGLPRLVMASSVHAVAGCFDWEKEPYASLMKREPENVPNLPAVGTNVSNSNSPYGAQKIYMEELGKYVSSQGVNVVCLRLGGVNPEDEADLEEPGWCYYPFWLSHRDCVHLFERCLETDLPPYSLLYGVSDNKYRIVDLEPTRQILGYEPQGDSSDRLQN